MVLEFRRRTVNNSRHQEGLELFRRLVEGSQAYYLKIYRLADLPLRQLQAKNQYLGVSPRYGLEAIGIAAMAFLAGFLVLRRGGGDSVFPLLGALALGARRLLSDAAGLW